MIPEARRYEKKTVRRIAYDGRLLTIDIQGPAFSYAQVVFRNPVGIRVLDERELCEFWNTYSEPHGWGGWLELERGRTTFTGFIQGLREFMIVDDKCINVLCTKLPRLIDLGADPGKA
ncbi:MAG TPA: hypothetical protein VK348_07750 [Planctomycetota bacterium]|nr:hypothetical protein [Planctomycetota bacterium]